MGYFEFFLTFRLKESSARSTIERMKTNNKSSKKPDKTSSSSSPPFDQRQPTSPKLSHQPSKSIMLLYFMQHVFKWSLKLKVLPVT